MNKQEKIICLILGAVLAWWMFGSFKQAKTAAEEAAAAATNEVAVVEAQAPKAETEVAAEPKAEEPKSAPVVEVLPTTAEEIVSLENDEVKIELSSWGAVVKAVTLKKFARDCGEISETNPAVVIEYGKAPIGRKPGALEAFAITEKGEDSVTFVCGEKTRKITLKPNYEIVLEDNGIGGAMSIGSMAMGEKKDDILSIDSCSKDGKVIHHGDDGDSPLNGYLRAGSLGGCGCSASPATIDKFDPIEYGIQQKFVAIKNRFFVTALVESTAANSGFVTEIVPAADSETYRLDRVTTTVKFEEKTDARKATFYVGPKKQSLLSDHGMREVMEFGMWSWLCYPIVWLLNAFYAIIPNYGVAIILLTIFVRLIFWPLTRKSTIGMKKMQEIQPLVKELQTKYKDNPQRMQQEMWQLYREKQVNPLSSCLPMLVQIPIFIALFNVLRSAVELRYAPFLWISDLSEPEALFASWFPFGGLNILPILMAVTTGLQSYFTPSAAGQQQQQKMMMVFMPVMMLFMFYSFPSALSLYWFLSNVFSIVQMWIIRRQTSVKKVYAAPDQIIDPPKTRQMRRH